MHHYWNNKKIYWNIFWNIGKEQFDFKFVYSIVYSKKKKKYWKTFNNYALIIRCIYEDTISLLFVVRKSKSILQYFFISKNQN